MRKKYSKENILNSLKEYKDDITSVAKWNDFIEGKDLPHSQTIISHFGTWNNFKSQLNLEVNDINRPKKYSDKDLLNILRTYKKYYRSVQEWNIFAEENNLPKHHFFVQRLGSDVLFKETGIVIKWTDEMLSKCIKKHYPKEPPTITEWKELMIKSNNIPHYQTIVRHYGSWRNMYSKLYPN